MVKTEKRRILSKFISRQVEAIYKKYLNISQEEEDSSIASDVARVPGTFAD